MTMAQLCTMAHTLLAEMVKQPLLLVNPQYQSDKGTVYLESTGRMWRELTVVVAKGKENPKVRYLVTWLELLNNLC